MVVYVLGTYDDGVVGVYTSKELAEGDRMDNHELGYYHYEDQWIVPAKLISEVIDD